MLRFIAFLFIGLAAAVSGCATFSTEECESGDWHKIGAQDGRDGQLLDRFTHHAKACKLDQSEASREAYMAGREKGLAEYCTDTRGYREGALGQKYLGVCPEGSASRFLKGYSLGRRIYELEARQSEITTALRGADNEATRKRLEAEDARLKQEIAELRAQADQMVATARKREKPN